MNKKKKLFFLINLLFHLIVINCHHQTTKNINNVYHSCLCQQEKIIKKQKDLTLKQQFFNNQYQLLLNKINEQQEKITKSSITIEKKKYLLTNYQLLKTLIEKQKKVNNNKKHNFGYYLLLSIFIINTLTIIFCFVWQYVSKSSFFLSLINEQKIILFPIDEYDDNYQFNDCFNFYIENIYDRFDRENFFYFAYYEKIILLMTKFFLLYDYLFQSVINYQMVANEDKKIIFNAHYSLAIFNETRSSLKNNLPYDQKQEIIMSFIYRSIIFYNCCCHFESNHEIEENIKACVKKAIIIDQKINPQDNIIVAISRLITFINNHDNDAFFHHLKFSSQKIISFNKKKATKIITTKSIISSSIKNEQLIFLLPRCFINFINQKNSFSPLTLRLYLMDEFIKNNVFVTCKDIINVIKSKIKNNNEKEINTFLQSIYHCFFHDYLMIIQQRFMNSENYQVKIINHEYQLRFKETKNNNNNFFISLNNKIINKIKTIIKEKKIFLVKTLTKLLLLILANYYLC